jgi:hypothetical protein
MEISKDMYLEIAKVSDDRTILQMLDVNKKFNDPEFFRELIIRKYPVLFKFKKIDEDWKHFYLRIVKYMAKLREEFDYTLSLDVDPEQFYKCKKLLNKMNKWRTQEVDYFDLYEAPNIFELLYNDEQNGNHDSVGSYIINQKTLAREDYMDELYKLTPIEMFGEESYLYDLTGDIQIVDSLSDREELVYDYKLLLEVLERNGKTFQEYENVSGMSLEMVKNYPKKYDAKLSENPLMHDMKFLHDNIRRKTNALVKFLTEQNDGASTYEELILTDEEIDFLLSIHRRILDPEDELTIISLVNCKDLI